MSTVLNHPGAPTLRPHRSWPLLCVGLFVVFGCDSNPTPHPGQPDAYPDTVHPNTDRDPENPNAGADAVEVHVPDPDATDPTHGFEDDHCDTHDTTSTDTDALTDTATSDAGPTDTGDTSDTTETSDPCDPTSRSPAAAESDSDFSTSNPPPTGPR